MKLRICLLLLGAMSQGLAQISASAILQRVDQIRSPGADFTFMVRVDYQHGVETSTSELEVWVRERDKSLVFYRQPSHQQGRALLLDGHNLWIYIPGSRRPLRISPQQRLMGGAANIDVARVIFSLDYSADRLEVSSWQGLSCLTLQLTALKENATYYRIHLWVRADNYQPIRAEFFGHSGKRLRTVNYRDYQHQLGEMRPTTLEIINPLNKEEKTILYYSKLRRHKTPIEYYQPAYLSRLK